tara:strand:- start:160 stop:333 length:174 start_codon:yes stop_codon:yes gene_type:complete
MFTTIATITLTVMAAYVCFMLNEINRDNQYIRLSIDEVESAVINRHWVVFDNERRAR